MKKIIISLILTASIFYGCGGRQSAVQKSKKVQETSSEVQEVKKVKTDSSGTKKIKEQEETSTKTNTNSWKYTAPAVIDFPCLNGTVNPFFIKTPAGDSIDVSRLPAGSSLETLNESSEKSSKYLREIDEQSKMIRDLEAKLSRKEKAKTIEVEKIKEVERQSIQWLLVAAALFIGTFIPSLFKMLWRLIKSRFKF